jgi:hypothetical protein
MKAIAVWSLLCCCGVNARGTADEPLPPVALPVPVRELSAQLRESLVTALPNALAFETSNNWGHQAHVPSLQGVKPIHVLRNHGHWEKARVVTWPLPWELSVRVVDVSAPDDNRVAFTVCLATPATVELDKQIWQNGIEIYSGHVRARFQLTANVTADPVARDAAAPQRDLRFQVAHATFVCDRFVTENVNGVGGDLARLIGAQRKFKAWQPPILRDFQEAVLGAVQAASATDEVRARLSQIVVQALAMRSIIVSANSIAPRGPLPASAPVVVAPAPIFLCGGVAIQIPIRIEASHAWQREAAVRPEHAEHWNLSTYTIRYESSTHAGHHSDSGTAAHDHKR